MCNVLMNGPRRTNERANIFIFPSFPVSYPQSKFMKKICMIDKAPTPTLNRRDPAALACHNVITMFTHCIITWRVLQKFGCISSVFCQLDG